MKIKKLFFSLMSIITAIAVILPATSTSAKEKHYDGFVSQPSYKIYNTTFVKDGKKYKTASKSELRSMGINSERAFGIDLDESVNSTVCLILGLDTALKDKYQLMSAYDDDPLLLGIPGIENDSAGLYEYEIPKDLNVIFTDNFLDYEYGKRSNGKEYCARKITSWRTYENKNGGQYYEIYRKINDGKWEHLAYVLDDGNQYFYRKYDYTGSDRQKYNYKATIFYDNIPEDISIYGGNIQYKIRLVKTNKKAKITKKTEFSQVLTYVHEPDDLSNKYSIGLTSKYTIDNNAGKFACNNTVYKDGYTNAPGYDVYYTLPITSLAIINAFTNDSDWEVVTPNNAGEILICKKLKDGTVLYNSFNSELGIYNLGNTTTEIPDLSYDNFIGDYLTKINFFKDDSYWVIYTDNGYFLQNNNILNFIPNYINYYFSGFIYLKPEREGIDDEGRNRDESHYYSCNDDALLCTTHPGHYVNLTFHMPLITFYAEKNGEKISGQELRNIYDSYKEEIIVHIDEPTANAAIPLYKYSDQPRYLLSKSEE